ncbi:NeuD/PglB/VioB family sugar acetyltransferase [Mariniflexile jejuense]|uniref:NeuD/PglB/VioB family sugar acetyltransferase n=1 Tax=Mariniflexile jejuense TaxID=1173582 RepID=A0ABW3JE71_9FLAO
METQKENIIVFGASGHAKVVIDIIEKENKYTIVGLIDSFKPKNYTILNYKILGTENDLPILMKEFNFKAGIIAIGDNWIRRQMYDKIVSVIPEFEFITAIHPMASIGRNVKVGKGTVIMPGAIANIDCQIGDFCILNTKSSLDHDSVIHKFSSLAPDATVGGNVKIGAYSAICLGARVIQDITIGKHSVIGAAAMVNRDIGDYKMAYGVPAKVIKSIKQGEKYLYHVEYFAKEKFSTTNQINLEVITGKTGWDNLLKEIEAYDFYHTYDYHTLSKSENEIPILIKYTEKDTMIALPLLVRDIQGTNYKDATSVYGYAGPICKCDLKSFDNRNFKKSLIEYFIKNNFVSIFSRLNPFFTCQNEALKGIGSIYHQGKVVNINLLQDCNIQRQNYQSRLKTHINKARRMCSIKKAITQNDIDEFKAIYFENMDRVHAKRYYYFSDAYFNKIINSDDFESEILLAIDNETGQTIAGCQFILTNGIVQYHLSGTKNDFLHLTPTKLLIDEMRLIASQRGCKFFNLGGGLGGSDNDSLFNFKSSFSKDFKEFDLWKFIVNEEIYNELVLKKGVNSESDFFPLYRSLEDLNISL